jgi:PIN domain nuclease of toxin-antitoxin system
MLLLDTHAFVWLVSDQTRLSPKAVDAIRSHPGQLCLSGISGLEIALAVKRGRLDLPTDAETFVRRGLVQHGIQEIPVTATLGCQAAQLPNIHNDPFDRIIVATAQAHGLSVVSKDAVLPQYPRLCVIWDDRPASGGDPGSAVPATRRVRRGTRPH